MRVGLVGHCSCGGSSRIAAELALGLVRMGHEVHLFTRTPSFFMPPGQTVVHCHTVHAGRPEGEDSTSLRLQWSPAELAAMRELITDNMARAGLDVLHIHYALPFVWLLREMRGRGADLPATVLTLHGTDLEPFRARNGQGRALAAALAGVDGLTTVSHGHADRLRQLSGRRWGIEVIPNFLSANGSSGAPPKPPLSPARIVYVSNFRPTKNAVGAVEVLAHLSRAADARLTMVGDGQCMAEARAAADRRGLSERVHFAGLTRDVASALRSAHIMLVTSHYESFGLAMLEAMSHGVPVVAPEVGGIPEIVRHGREGFIYAPGDLPAAAGAILGLLRRPARLRAMAGQAVKRSRDFAREAVLPRYESLYRRVLSKEAAHG